LVGADGIGQLDDSDTVVGQRAAVPSPTAIQVAMRFVSE